MKKNETSSELMIISPFMKFSCLRGMPAFKKIKNYVSECVYRIFSEENEKMKLVILDGQSLRLALTEPTADRAPLDITKKKQKQF